MTNQFQKQLSDENAARLLKEAEILKSIENATANAARSPSKK